MGFEKRNAGKTLVSKSQGLKLSTEGLKGRVLEVNLADLQDDESHAYRKIKLEVQEVQGRSCLTDFHGMSLTRDKQAMLVKKWHTLIEAHTKVKTTDGCILPVQNCYIRSVKMLKKPKFDLTKLMELHTGSHDDVGTEMLRDEDEAAQNTLPAEIN